MSKFYKGCGPQKLGCSVKLDGSNGHEGGAPFINPGVVKGIVKGVKAAKNVIQKGKDKAKEAIDNYDAKDGKEGNAFSQFLGDAGKVVKTAGKAAVMAGSMGTPFKLGPLAAVAVKAIAPVVAKKVMDKASGGPTFKGADHTNSTCWDGYEKKGTKISSRTGRRVNNCVKK